MNVVLGRGKFNVMIRAATSENVPWIYESSKDSEQPAYSRSLIRIITWRKLHITKTRLFKYINKISPPKYENFQMKNSDIFLISAQNIDCRYSLEPPRWGGSNEYPHSMFLSRNKKNNVYPCKPQFYYIKVGFMGSKLYRHVFVMISKAAKGFMWTRKILIRLCRRADWFKSSMDAHVKGCIFTRRGLYISSSPL